MDVIPFNNHFLHCTNDFSQLIVSEIKYRLIRTPGRTDRVVEHVGSKDEFDEKDFKIACTKKGTCFR